MRRSSLFASILVAGASLAAFARAASPLEGQTYIIEIYSIQSASGYASYLVPPRARAIAQAGLKPKGGPGADVVFDLMRASDEGQWVDTADGRKWLYTVSVTTGISAAYVIPCHGAPQFGVTARLVAPNPDREDELVCLIELATRQAIARYRPEGLIKISGQSCLRQ